MFPTKYINISIIILLAPASLERWSDNRYIQGFRRGSDGQEFSCNVGDLGSIPGLGRSPRGGHGNPLQYSCLENAMDRGAWWATVHGVAKSQTRLSDFTFFLNKRILKIRTSLFEIWYQLYWASPVAQW